MTPAAGEAGRFVGIGVPAYASPLLGDLPAAAADVARLSALLPGFRRELATDTDEPALRKWLRGLRDAMPQGGPVLAVWSGHGVRSANGRLRLLAADSARFDSDGIDVDDLVAACVELAPAQLLLVVDTCHSGGGSVSAMEVAIALLSARPPDAEHVWVGVLASSQPEENARDGELGALLARLLEHGPDDPLLRLRWSEHNRMIRGDDLCDAVVKEWSTPAHWPRYLASGSAWYMLPNPLWRGDAIPGVVEHLLRAARAGGSASERPAFVGRSAEVAAVAGWVRARVPGLHVVTGLPGTGKSALVGRVVSLSDPVERARILALDPGATGDPGEGTDPGERSVDAHVHARGLTADRMAELLGGQLEAAGLLPGGGPPRTAALLVGELQHRAAAGGDVPAPVVVVDGLDEARGEVLGIVDDLLLRLAALATVVVATRDQPGRDEGTSLVARLDPEGRRLDLSAPGASERGRGDVAAYLVERLTGVDPRMDPAAVAGLVVRSMAGDRPFLLARVLGDALRSQPVDTTEPGWEGRVATSFADAFEADLYSVPEPERALPQGVTPTAYAVQLLRALTHGYGAGLPLDEWVAVASATGPVTDVTAADAVWLLDVAGRYVVQDGESGVAVYRVAHQSVADAIRSRYRPVPEAPFDPVALPVARALLGRYEGLLSAGVPVTEPGYLWLYALRHAADAGPDGLALLRTLAERAPRLAPDVATASLGVAAHLAMLGEGKAAVGPIEEAVRLRRGWLGDDVLSRINLAVALNDCGVAYAQVARTAEAIEVTREAAELFRSVAATDAGYAVRLAQCLTSLAIWLSGVGEVVEALPYAREATEILREQLPLDPTADPQLSRALTVLSALLAANDDEPGAHAAATESVERYRAAAAADPGLLPILAASLGNLSTRQAMSGRSEQALATVSEAVQMGRSLSGGSRLYLSDLAGALTLQATYLSGLGRTDEAVAPALESVAKYRTLAQASPAHVPMLARALTSAAYLMAGAGPGVEGAGAGEGGDGPLPLAEEAVELLRPLAERHAGLVPELARSLVGLGLRQADANDLAAAVASTREAVGLYRPMVDLRPAHRPELASALANLAVWEPGSAEAVALAAEAVATYRPAYAASPAHGPELARALLALGVALRLRGAAADGERRVGVLREALAVRSAALPDRAAVGAWAGIALELGAALLRTGEAGEGVAHLDAAVRRIGELAASGAPPTQLLGALFGPDMGVPEEVRSRAWAAWAVGLPEDAVERLRRALALAWVLTPTYTAEREFLAGCPWLLSLEFEPALAGLGEHVGADEAARYRDVVLQARAEGVEAAYAGRFGLGAEDG